MQMSREYQNASEIVVTHEQQQAYYLFCYFVGLRYTRYEVLLF